MVSRIIDGTYALHKPTFVEGPIFVEANHPLDQTLVEGRIKIILRRTKDSDTERLAGWGVAARGRLSGIG